MNEKAGRSTTLRVVRGPLAGSDVRGHDGRDADGERTAPLARHDHRPVARKARRVAWTIEHELPERRAGPSDAGDLDALTNAIRHCDLVTYDAFMADVLRRTRLDRLFDRADARKRVTLRKVVVEEAQGQPGHEGVNPQGKSGELDR
jgi:hypothetical protein